MKKTQFRVGLLTACLIGVGSIASAQSCGAEGCAAKPCKCSQKNCDDRGLMDVINTAASSFEARLASMIPSRERSVKRTSCGCSQCQAAGGHDPLPLDLNIVPPSIHEEAVRPPMSSAAVPQPIPETIHAPHPGISHPHTPHPTTAHPGKPDLIPVPDAQKDPFTDETTRTLRPIPALPANYLKSKAHSASEFDPQARSATSLRSAGVASAAAKSTSEKTLASNRSTRRGQVQSLRGGSHSEPSDLSVARSKLAERQVVPASNLEPVFPVPSAPALSTSGGVVNPLRGPR